MNIRRRRQLRNASRFDNKSKAELVKMAQAMGLNASSRWKIETLIRKMKEL